MRPRTLTLTAAQRAELERARDRDPRPYLRERAAALLKVAGGTSPRQVALGGLHRRRGPKTVCDWLDRYQRDGVAGLVQRPRRPRGFSPSARGGAGRDGAPGAGIARDRPRPLAAG